MKFRKKPIVIEAQLFHPDGPKIEGVIPLEVWVLDCKCTEYFVQTLEGNMRVNPGDWIITGVAGEKYPCKADIFEKTYEAVDET